jgi:hypothetical protein
MILTLTDNDGVVLDTTTVTPEEWRQAETRAVAAQGILLSLKPGELS